jgi:hypothetical protein
MIAKFKYRQIELTHIYGLNSMADRSICEPAVKVHSNGIYCQGHVDESFGGFGQPLLENAPILAARAPYGLM